MSQHFPNTTIVMQNGGKISNGGNNWPLRGEKKGIYEGGTRGVTIVDGPILEKRGYTNEGLFHAIDWTPTLMHFAEGTEQTGLNILKHLLFSLIYFS